MKSARVRAGLDETISFHNLRHTFASAQISHGASVKALRVALGHSSASETLDVYGHLWSTDEDRIRDGASHLLSAVFDADSAIGADPGNATRTSRRPTGA